MPDDLQLSSRQRRLIMAAIALYLLHLAYAIFVSRGLYADGVYFFAVNLERRSFLIWGGLVRFFSQSLAQWPVVLAVNCGVTSMPALLLLQGCGLFGWFAVSLWLCWWAVRREPRYMLFPLAGVFAGAMNAEFDAITDSHRFVCLFWPLLLLMLFRTGRLAAAVTVLLAIPMLMAYETMLCFGPMLAGVALWRRGQAAAGSAARRLWTALAAWFGAGTLVALQATIDPEIPSNRMNFWWSMTSFLQLSNRVHYPVLFSLAALAAMALMLSGRPAWLNRTPVLAALAGIGMAAGGVIACLPIAAPATLDVRMHHDARVLNLMVPFVLALALFAVRAGWLAVAAAPWRRAWVVVAVLGIVQSLWHLGATYQWSRYLTILRDEVESNAGLIPYERSAQSRLGDAPYHNSASMNWHWTLPLTSIIVSRGGRVNAIVENPVGIRESWQPFDPRVPEQLPDLRRYGITYSREIRVPRAKDETPTANGVPAP